ncbi:hypothetical protein JYU34_010666, partial [Plutella xylostella]
QWEHVGNSSHASAAVATVGSSGPVSAAVATCRQQWPQSAAVAPCRQQWPRVGSSGHAPRDLFSVTSHSRVLLPN